MTTTSSVSLVAALRQYRLLETVQLEEVNRNLQTLFPDSKALAGELIRRGWLTPFQANQLLQGRGQELLLGSYVLLERLGEGGMGQVFKARNWKLGRIVALKLIRKERLDNPDAIRRFEREVRSAAALSHPNIVHAYDADQVGGTHLLVMEYVEGTDLARLVKKNSPLPVPQACEYIRQGSVDASKVGRLEVLPGEHKLTVKQGAEELYTETFTLKSGSELVIEAKWTPKRITNGLGMELVLAPKGKSWLGGGNGKPGDKEVEIPYDFYLGKYEVTQEEWEKVMGSNPSLFKAVAGVKKEDQKRYPVENVSWDDAQQFLGLLNAKEKESGWMYRLPKEAEWEYGCRGGPLPIKSRSAFDFYLDMETNQITTEQANIEHGKGLKRTCKVGSYKPNRLGLYDMHGNVWEWCDDTEKAADGASLRVYRGGSWDTDSGYCRAATRSVYPPSYRLNNIGLRVARVPVGKEGK